MSDTWCTRCKCYHTQKPLDEEALLKKLSKQIADDIDREILASLLGETSTREINIE